MFKKFYFALKKTNQKNMEYEKRLTIVNKYNFFGFSFMESLVEHNYKEPGVWTKVMEYRSS